MDHPRAPLINVAHNISFRRNVSRFRLGVITISGWAEVSRGCVGALSVLLLMSMTAAPAMAGPKLDRLEALWTEHMLDGTQGQYAYGRPTNFRNTRDYTWAKGSVLVASATNRGIDISDLSGIGLLGLIQGAGWTIHGGLLARADVDGGFLELYGSRVVRWRGGFLGFGIHHEEEDVTYEFFLLNRPGATRALIIHRWSIPTEDIVWTRKQPMIHEVPRGSLSYDAVTKTAVVTVTGLRRAHEYTVDVTTIAANP